MSNTWQQYEHNFKSEKDLFHCLAILYFLSFFLEPYAYIQFEI